MLAVYSRARAVLVLAILMVLGLWSAHARLTPVVSADATDVDIVGHIGGASLTVDIQGDYAYVGEGTQLTILDVSDPAAPVVAGKSPVLPDVVEGVAVEGNYAYVVIGYEGLSIMDVSNPSAPTVVGTLDGPGDLKAIEVVVAGQYAYVAAGSNGLWIVDVTNPAAPTEVSVTEINGDALSLDVAGNFAYVASGEDLFVVDVTAPEAPVEAGAYGHNNGEDQADVAVLGDYAYIVSDGGELEVVDITDSAAPVGVGYMDLPYWSSASGLTVAGNDAYVVDSSGGLIAVDVSDPANPAEIGYLAQREGDSLGPVAVVVAGDHVYFNDYLGLRIADISDPTSPMAASAYDTVVLPYGLTTTGDYVYVADGYAGLVVIDAADPAHPGRVGAYDTPGLAREVVVSGDYAYIADGDGGLQIIDVADPTAPAAVGSLGGSGEAVSLDVEGNYAYMTTWVNGSGYFLRVIDVSDPANPVQVGSLPTPGLSWSVDVVGGYAYVVNANYGGFVIIDVTSPTGPVQVGSYDVAMRVFSMKVVGDFAYLAADYNGGLRIVNIADPTMPVDAGSYDTPGAPEHLAVSGTVAYVADSDYGLRIIDVTDPALPVEVAYNDLMPYARDVAVAGRYAYVTADSGGLYVLKYPPDDDDGQSDETEDGAPNNGDGNNDGIPDSEQANVVSLPNSENDSYITLEAPAGIELVDVQATANPSPGDTPAGASFPIGFIDFEIEGLAPGEAVAVTIILHGGETVDTYYKYGPEPGEPADHWYEFAYDGTTGAEYLVGQIVLHFVDGERGDSDLTANGVIVDPGAPALESAAEATLYVGGMSSGAAGGVGFDKQDILAFDTGAETWAMHFDGSNVGVRKGLAAFALLPGGDLLLALKADQALPGVGVVTTRDVVRFTPSSVGDDTDGTFTWYVDGSDVGLTTSGEKIDALDVLADGRVLISTGGTLSVPNPGGGTIKAQDEDLVALTPTGLGETTTGTWALYFDGTAVPGLKGEDVSGAHVDEATGDLYLSLVNGFKVGGVSGNAKDILMLAPSGGGYTVTRFWRGPEHGFAPNLSGLEME